MENSVVKIEGHVVKIKELSNKKIPTTMIRVGFKDTSYNKSSINRCFIDGIILGDNAPIYATKFKKGDDVVVEGSLKVQGEDIIKQGELDIFEVRVTEMKFNKVNQNNISFAKSDKKNKFNFECDDTDKPYGLMDDDEFFDTLTDEIDKKTIKASK